MANLNSRPPGTKLLLPEDYVTRLEDQVKEKDQKVEIWRKCISETVDFLEILRSHFDDFDKVLKHFNEAAEGVQFVVDADENIVYKLNESKES